MTPQRVLVTDGDERSALALVRALGRSGREVVVCSRSGRSLAGGSRFCRAEHATPDPLAAPETFAQAVRRVVLDRAVDVLLPVSEPSLLALLPLRDRMPGVCLPFPDVETFRRICDKAELLRVAPEVGIAVPEQRVLAAPPGRKALRAMPLRFPLVVKPARSVGERDGRRAKLGVLHAADRDELARHLASLDRAAYPLLLQQRVVGPGVGIFLLLWGDEILAVFSHRRIREKPPAGGVSVYRASIPADPGLVARSVALLERFGWRGVAMVEYKVDAATGTPYLMEVNGRFWGSLQLAVDAGVDFPSLLVDAATGRDPVPVTSYRAGVRSRWEWGDVDHLLARLLRSPASLSLPPGEPGRFGVVRDFLKLWRPGDRLEVLRLDDPVPFLRESRQWFRQILAGRRRSASSTSTATTPTTDATPSPTSGTGRSSAASPSSA